MKTLFKNIVSKDIKKNYTNPYITGHWNSTLFSHNYIRVYTKQILTLGKWFDSVINIFLHALLPYKFKFILENAMFLLLHPTFCSLLRRMTIITLHAAYSDNTLAMRAQVTFSCNLLGNCFIVKLLLRLDKRGM